MSPLNGPATVPDAIDLSQLAAACAALGLDPDQVTSIHMEPDRVAINLRAKAAGDSGKVRPYLFVIPVQR